MPNAKKRSKQDSDTSDSGPEDREPPPKKQEKSKKSSSRGDDDEEPTWVLDKKRLLKVREFKGRLMVDIREYYESDGDLKPGKKGIALSIQQWRKLVDSMSEIDDAIKSKA